MEARFGSSLETAALLVGPQRGGERIELAFEHGVEIVLRQLAAVVSDAADKGNYPVVLLATMLMALIVLAVNRLIWSRLYTLASTRFRLEA